MTHLVGWFQLETHKKSKKQLKTQYIFDTNWNETIRVEFLTSGAFRQRNQIRSHTGFDFYLKEMLASANNLQFGCFESVIKIIWLKMTYWLNTNHNLIMRMNLHWSHGWNGWVQDSNTRNHVKLENLSSRLHRHSMSFLISSWLRIVKDEVLLSGNTHFWTICKQKKNIVVQADFTIIHTKNRA